MAEEETIRVRDGMGFRTIKKTDKKPEDVEWEDPGGVTMNNPVYGVTHDGKNPTGTYSEPTPSDVRFPDTNATEFEGNHLMVAGQNAAEQRDALGMEDKPGGIVDPDAPEPSKAKGKAAVAARAKAAPAAHAPAHPAPSRPA